MDGLMAAAETFRNSDASPFPYAIPGVTSTGKIAELIERGKVRTLYFFELLDAQLASNEFVAGDFFSAADITALCAYDFAIGTAVLEEIPGANVARWYAMVFTTANDRMVSRHSLNSSRGRNAPGWVASTNLAHAGVCSRKQRSEHNGL